MFDWYPTIGWGPLIQMSQLSLLPNLGDEVVDDNIDVGSSTDAQGCLV